MSRAVAVCRCVRWYRHRQTPPNNILLLLPPPNTFPWLMSGFCTVENFLGTFLPISYLQPLIIYFTVSRPIDVPLHNILLSAAHLASWILEFWKLHVVLPLPRQKRKGPHFTPVICLPQVQGWNILLIIGRENFTCSVSPRKRNLRLATHETSEQFRCSALHDLQRQGRPKSAAPSHRASCTARCTMNEWERRANFSQKVEKKSLEKSKFHTTQNNRDW